MAETILTRQNIDHYLYLVAKEYKKANRANPGCEIILVGGASVLFNYNFRESTTDIDSILRASSTIKDVINKIGDENGLPTGWINEDFKKTSSYSDKLVAHSKFYKTFYGCLNVRTVTGEYLLAMKLRSYRKYKHDMSDIIGIIKEQKELGSPLSIEMIQGAFSELYDEEIPADLLNTVNKYLNSEDLEDILYDIRNRENAIGIKLQEFEHQYPDVLNESNLGEIIEKFDTFSIPEGPTTGQEGSNDSNDCLTWADYDED